MRQAKVRMMAVLNVTPDSFSDGGRFSDRDAVLRAAEMALECGADILDIGGESTRPGAVAVSPEEELARVVPIIAAIHHAFPEALISVDTHKASVAEAALQAGARMVNDVSGLTGFKGKASNPSSEKPFSEMASVIARHQAWLVLMHSQGAPEVMQRDPSYPHGVIPEIQAFFERQTALAVRQGVARERMILDPGFGFGKTVAHNLTLLARLGDFRALGFPLMAGTSRKSFLTLGRKDLPVAEREALTAASLAIAIQQGARYVRVHDIATQAPVVRLAEALLEASSTN
jgi:dihydropteroate synthase